jgi:hypothetical protein
VYSALKLLSASTAFCDKPDSVLGRAVMALPLFFAKLLDLLRNKLKYEIVTR